MNSLVSRYPYLSRYAREEAVALGSSVGSPYGRPITNDELEVIFSFCLEFMESLSGAEAFFKWWLDKQDAGEVKFHEPDLNLGIWDPIVHFSEAEQHERDQADYFRGHPHGPLYKQCRSVLPDEDISAAADFQGILFRSKKSLAQVMGLNPPLAL